MLEKDLAGVKVRLAEEKVRLANEQLQKLKEMQDKLKVLPQEELTKFENLVKKPNMKKMIEQVDELHSVRAQPDEELVRYFGKIDIKDQIAKVVKEELTKKEALEAHGSDLTALDCSSGSCSFEAIMKKHIWDCLTFRRDKEVLGKIDWNSKYSDTLMNERDSYTNPNRKATAWSKQYIKELKATKVKREEKMTLQQALEEKEAIKKEYSIVAEKECMEKKDQSAIFKKCVEDQNKKTLELVMRYRHLDNWIDKDRNHEDETEKTYNYLWVGYNKNKHTVQKWQDSDKKVKVVKEPTCAEQSAGVWYEINECPCYVCDKGGEWHVKNWWCKHDFTKTRKD